MIRLIDIELYVFLHCISNHERPNPMFKYFKQKYKRCLDSNDETSSCFSIEHFSYDSDVVVDKGNLDNHYQYWVAKNRRGFKPLFETIHIILITKITRKKSIRSVYADGFFVYLSVFCDAL